MKIAYCSTFLPPEKDFTSKTKHKISGIAGHKFSSAIAEGLYFNLNENDSMTIFGLTNVINYPKFPQILFKKEKWKYIENTNGMNIGYINIFGLKYISQSHNLYKELDKWVKELDNDQGIICVYNIFYPVMDAAIKIKKKYGKKVKICLITGDMVKVFNLKSEDKQTPKQKLIDRLEDKIFQMVKSFDCFVFATQPMAEAYEVEDKPNVIVECTYLQKENLKHISKNIEINENKKIIFYAGSVRIEYGLKHLLNAFSLIANPNYELWIAGGGNCEDLINERAIIDQRIKFFGFVSPEKVDELTKKATVVINPRVEKGNEFVKYSFPSKTMDGLASGKPFIAHNLSCYPPEYQHYIQIPKDESDEALSKKIIEVCELSEEKRNMIALEAQKFILNEKNPKVMCKKIIEMFKNEIGKENK